MNDLKELDSFKSPALFAILCGVVLLKMQEKEINTIDNKSQFLNTIQNLTKNSKFNTLIELYKWISLNTASLDNKVFSSIYNSVSKFSPQVLMNWFNDMSIQQNFRPQRSSFVNNKSLNNLVTKIINLDSDNTFLEATATINGPWLQILKSNPYQKITLQATDPLEACFIYLNIQVNNGRNTVIHNKNFLTQPGYVKDGVMNTFDRIVTFPPLQNHFSPKLIKNSFNKSKYGTITSKNILWGYISNTISTLNSTGRAVTCISNGDLFGTASRKQIRNTIVNSDKIEAIISFPSGFLTHSIKPINLLIINNRKKLKNKILFIDANQKDWITSQSHTTQLTERGIAKIVQLLNSPQCITNISNIVNIKNCQETLMVNKHVEKNLVSIDNTIYHLNLFQIKKMDTIPLDSIAYIKRGYNMIVKDKSSRPGLKILKIADLANDNIDYSQLESIDVLPNITDKYLIHQNDIVFSVRGQQVGKAIFIKEEPDRRVMISYNLVIIRPKDASHNLKWLYIYLNSLLAKYYIKKVQSGSTVSSLSIKDLANFPIPVLSSKAEQRVIEHYEKGTQSINLLKKELAKKERDLNNTINHSFGLDNIFIPESENDDL